jgi:lipid-binding SYLF domain-containing protein
MKKQILPVMLAVLCALIPVFAFAAAAGTETEKIDVAVEVLEQNLTIPERGIPPQLLKSAEGIAVIPGVLKVGFVVGGRYGTGVVMVRKEGGWSPPVFISLTGGSLGWQIGAQSMDLILVFKTPRSVEGMMRGKVTLGADAAVAAGPVGRQVGGATDAALKAEIYSYSRSRGLFAGVSLEGSVLQIDDEANAAFYGREGIRAREIFAGKGIVLPPAAVKLHNALLRYDAGEGER